MLTAGEPKFRRRPADRPAEIVAAALEVFAERGFQAARLEEVARRAGVSKGALYLYFETKEELFRVVVSETIAPNLHRAAALADSDTPFEPTVRAIFGLLAQRVLADRRLGGVVKLVIAESRSRPELAEIWHQTLVEPALPWRAG